MKKNNSFLDTYKNLKVVITGTTGFKGAWLAYWLNNLGAKVIGIALKPERDAILFNSFNLAKKIKQYFIDIRNFNKLNNIIKLEKPSIVFHLAAQSIVSSSYKDPLNTISTNVLGSAHILESVRLNRVPNLVYITSDKCYLNIDKEKNYTENDVLGGFDNYSSSKASAELLFKSYLKSFFDNDFSSMASARAGNVIGGGDFKKDRIVPDVIRALNCRKNIFLRNPNATRPWQHVLEPLSGYLKLGDKLINKKIKKKILPSWNFGPNKANCKEVVLIVNLILKKWGNQKLKIISNKKKLFYESSLLSLNINKAKRELNWKPRLTLDETISLTVGWYKNFFLNNDVEKITSEQIEYFLNN